MKNKMKTAMVLFATLTIMLSLTWSAYAAPPTPPALLDPLTIPKWENQLYGPPPVYEPTVIMKKGQVIRHEYTVTMSSFMQQILPPSMNLMTPVWGYGGMAKDAVTGTSLGFVRNSPAPSFEAVRGIPIQVKWVNDVTTPHMFPVDPTLHWADPNNMDMPMAPFTPYPPGYPEAQSPVPLVAHLHGGEVQSFADGGPDEWFTWNGIHGPAYGTVKKTDPNAAIYYYPNMQQPTTLWYHDHALGLTRINVMSGLAGFYLLRDSTDTVAPLLPSGKYEVPLAIQDRTFYADGSFWFPTVGINPDIHPYWFPEFFGNTIMVDGLVWPNMNVDQGQYRLRLLDGSNARFYTLSFLNQQTGTLLPFVQVGSDGGYLKVPATLTELTFAPGERADVLIDFSGLPAGTKILLKNSAKAPFPAGTPADPLTVGQIMQFTVTGNIGFAPQILPTPLNPTLVGAYPTLPTPTNSRILTLFEMEGPAGPLGALLNGQTWDGVISEFPAQGSTEEWAIVDTTGDTHPIHLHLVQFQLVSRQKINIMKYTADWIALQQQFLGDPTAMPPWPTNFIPQELPVGPYLVGMLMPAPPNEQGWKDTVRMNPAEVTIIRVRWASQDGSPYTFDPAVGPGYVWHCHIIDHEDNEMMRPYHVAPKS